MEKVIAALQRLPDRRRARDISYLEFHSDLLESADGTRGAHQGADPDASGPEPSRDVESDEAAGSRHESAAFQAGNS
jgi:hypothetical protein